MKESYACPSCGDIGGSHYSSCSSKNPPSESLRYSIDILEKWSIAMTHQWKVVSHEMDKLSISPPRALKISDFALIDENGFWITLKNAKLSIREAVTSLSFDTDLLPQIRQLTVEALVTRRKKVEDTRAAALKAKLDKEAKLNSLPKMIDDFGADIMTYGPTEPKKKEDMGPRAL